MFYLQKPETFKWPVNVNIPQQDGSGRFTTATFTAEFKLHSQSEMDQKLEALRNDDVDVLRDLLVGWGSEVCDPNTKQNIPYSHEARDAMLDITYVRTALLKAYFDAANGQKVKK